MPDSALRSAQWFGGRDLAGFIHRASLAAATANGRPIVGICNPWSELVHCNLHFRGLAESVRRGIAGAGGIPVEFSTISLGENLMKPTTMLYRNLMAMDVEESIRAYPLDAVVLIGGCDKTVPAELMGAASADIPAIMVTGGPEEPVSFRGRRVSSGTDLWHSLEDRRAERLTQAEFEELEAAAAARPGHCNEMGTASTMTSLVEALGLALPGTASIPALHPDRARAAEAAGARAVALAFEGPRPSEILTAEAFDNAITLLMALGGGTNAVVHLLALAGRAGVPLTLERFHELSSRTPLLANLLPSGEFLVEDLHRAGGIPAVLGELAPLLDGNARTVAGTLADGYARVDDRAVIAPLDAPLALEGGIAVVRGSLAPAGAIVKRSAASPALLRHRGPAIVFDGIDDLAARIEHVDATPDSVLVLRNVGPKGGPGMPEWGQLPIPKRLLERGVTDLVRISDARMSGTAYGTVVLHVAPEAAAGGPLRAVQDGDPIVLDVDAQRLDLEVDADEVVRRLERLGAPEPKYRRGYGALYLEHVLQADEGCDFDFLRGRDDREPYGLLTDAAGWIGGW
jgi:dihydroxy-acid dehydratase